MIPQYIANHPERTTAHDHVYRFYKPFMRPARGQSILERICTASDESALEMVIKDAINYPATRRQWRQWIRATMARTFQLRAQAIV